jgi:hypothetical protein
MKMLPQGLDSGAILIWPFAPGDVEPKHQLPPRRSMIRTELRIVLLLLLAFCSIAEAAT